MLRGERDQNTDREGVLSRLEYQIAPGGARSKLVLHHVRQPYSNTRLLRGERDQNRFAGLQFRFFLIPDCSGGSEIKTLFSARMSNAEEYQIAPGGARSKLSFKNIARELQIPDCSGGSEIKTGHQQRRTGADNTRLLRGERDQNSSGGFGMSWILIPDCSGGSEIKTR